MIRLGLCCKFYREPIRFRTTTARYTAGLSRAQQRKKLAELCLANALSLRESIEYCAGHGIGSFRVNSQVLPLRTHPEVGYDMTDLPGGHEIVKAFRACGPLARKNDIRLTFHPDQFILLSSADKEITRKSVQELEYQAEVSAWIGADVINIHGGGAYGDKQSALTRVARNVRKLSRRVRKRLTVENDDRVYTPADLLPLCEDCKVPFVYDVHHHRCLPDGLSVEEVTDRALATWDREPLFHVSSPRSGWKSTKPQPHHDDIMIADFPECWRDLDVTVEVEAKAKELAVERLRKKLLKS